MGKFHAYVAASRPRTRQQLAITEHITLSDLRKRLPANLIQEGMRLDALAHNTLVDAGVIKSTRKSVPGISFTSNIISKCSIIYNDTRVRPSSLQNSADECLMPQESQRDITDRILNSDIQEVTLPIPRFCCRWKSNFSCAYDAAVVALSTVSARLKPQYRTDLENISEHMRDISMSVQTLETNTADNLVMERLRDKLRSDLSAFNLSMFPASDAALVGVADIFNVTCNRCIYLFKLRLSACCHVCGSLNSTVLDSYAGDQCLIPCLSPRRSSNGNQRRIDNTYGVTFSTVSFELGKLVPFDHTVYTSINEAHRVSCPSDLQYSFTFASPPPLLYFEIDQEATVPCYASKKITISSDNLQYGLASIIYYGSAHFTCDLFTQSDIYRYDGMKAGGTPQRLCSLQDMTVAEGDCVWLDRASGNVPCVYVYGRL